ncbi:hypothetical protein NWE73_16585 [Bdellovibrio sp. PAP01]|uniref:Serine aminopeptidase S33 domain-containing protein n=2 Tax=Bdellovibrio svalbardensis TaxID=2972972 RepID=A0ABT6DM83_9BACT|nr:hypothetical protein [Bdellovibrio svalbardensis]
MTSLIYSLVLSVLLFSVTAPAQTEQQFVREIIRQSGGELPKADAASDIPDGLSTKDMSPACDPKLFEDSLLAKKVSSAEYYSQIKSYFDKCGKELSLKSAVGGLASLAKASSYEYPFFQHSQIKSITIKLPNGTQVPAIAALKQDPRPRPLVVVKCGVFCSATESPSMIENLMSLFDQSPFNVVLLANQTGLDHIALNHIVSIGGWTEGAEVIEVGRWLKDQWAFKDRISSIHLMGLSLGGNAAVFGAAYNDMQAQLEAPKVYSSVMAVCPVVALKPTLQSLYGSTLVGSVFAKLTKDQFLAARKDVTDVPDLLTTENIPSNKKDMTDYLGLINAVSLQRRGTAVSANQYFKNNNFWSLPQKVTTPMLVWASKDDIVVDNKINAQSVENDPYYKNSSTVGVVNLPYGSHCSFSAAYGVLASTIVMKTFVLAHSPEFTAYDSQNQMPWKFESKKLSPKEIHIGQVWKFSANSDQVKISFRTFTTSALCNDPWAGSDQCISSKEIAVPVVALANMGARIPANAAEAAAFSREFNAKVQFKTKDLKPLNGTNTSEFNVVWREALN